MLVYGEDWKPDEQEQSFKSIEVRYIKKQLNRFIYRKKSSDSPPYEVIWFSLDESHGCIAVELLPARVRR